MVTVAVKNCCGKVVGYETRKPKAGEKEFVQCRCAEKRASQHNDANLGGRQFEAMPLVLIAFVTPEPLAEVRAEHPYAECMADNPAIPPDPPPA
jgi:hypothetical protein